MAATDTRPLTAGRRGRNRGFSMIEVLTSLLIIQIGLLGLVGTQVVAQRAEAEAYQRAQAVILLNDMVERINANRSSASCFAFTDATTGTPYLGVNDGGHYTPGCSTGDNASMANQAMTAWDDELQGSAEVNSSSVNVGAITNARGCVTSVVTGGITVYYIGVAWQGLSNSFGPSSFTGNATNIANCGVGLYGADTQRRLVWTSVQIASLN